VNNRSNLPERSRAKRADRNLVRLSTGAAAHESLLGEGNSSGLVLKARPSPGKSEVSQDEVITHRRQAEVDLNTERCLRR
jgi:hypothetical protein